jgi:hypothetical protein
MRRIIGCLFPWRKTIRRLELENHWWHRLAVVLFFVTLIAMFLFSWVIGDDVDSPSNSYDSEIHDWGGTGGTLFDLSTFQPLDNNSSPVAPPPIVQKTIEMPDGKTVTYPGITSDETVKAEWKHRLNVATTKAALLGFAIAVLTTVIFSYLLQAGYRVVLYVIYGAIAGQSVIDSSLTPGVEFAEPYPQQFKVGGSPVADGKANRYWPNMDSSENAIQAMHNGAGAAVFTTLISAGFGAASLFLGHPVLGMDGWVLVDAAIFAVIAWRIYRLSLPWAITGLALFTLEKAFSLVNGQATSGIVVAIIFWLFYLHAVRGGLYLRKARKATAAEPSPVRATTD